MLPAPRFHHLHLNSVDPDAAIAFYLRQFPSTARTEWAGVPALRSPNDVLILFDKVDRPHATVPQSAIWHFGWHVTDVRRNRDAYLTRPEVELLPLYTGEADASVLISTDSWPGRDGVLGLTRAQIADARAAGVLSTRRGGFAYMRGPDDAIVEYMGDYPAERMNHVHFFHEVPLAAQRWYVTHLGATPLPPRAGSPPGGLPDRRGEPTWPALEREGLIRVPTAGVAFGDVAFSSYMRQGATPLVPSRGHLYDHVALGVADLDAWIAKLGGEGVTFLEPLYRLGAARAVMIEGPSCEAIELVEIS